MPSRRISRSTRAPGDIEAFAAQNLVTLDTIRITGNCKMLIKGRRGDRQNPAHQLWTCRVFVPPQVLV